MGLTEQVMEDGGWISALQEEGRGRDVVFKGRSNLCQEAAFERQGKLRTNKTTAGNAVQL